MPTLRYASLVCLIVGFASHAMTGCGSGGPKAYPVTGTVKLKGGDVLKQGNIQFQSKKFTGSGTIGADGKYTVSSMGAGDGIPEGTYKVVLLSTSTGGGYGAPEGSKETRVIDAKYEGQDTSPIEVKVPGGTYDFEVDPPATP